MSKSDRARQFATEVVGIVSAHAPAYARSLAAGRADHRGLARARCDQADAPAIADDAPAEQRQRLRRRHRTQRPAGAEQHRGPEIGEQHHGAVALVVMGAHVQDAGAGGGVAVDVPAVVALGPEAHVVGLRAAPAPPGHDPAGQARQRPRRRAEPTPGEVAQAHQRLAGQVDAGGQQRVAGRNGRGCRGHGRAQSARTRCTRPRMTPRAVWPSAAARQVRPMRWASASAARSATSSGTTWSRPRR